MQKSKGEKSGNHAYSQREQGALAQTLSGQLAFYQRLQQTLVTLPPFIGRASEVQEICELLQVAGLRLCTITGAAGVGKTRLALKVAAQMQSAFADGVCYVPLASLQAPEFLLSALFQALDVRMHGDSPLLTQLQKFLYGKHIVLVLDNFEHLLSAAPLLIDLLQSCPKLKLLVTSRVALHIQGEHEYLLTPLAVDDLTKLTDVEVVIQNPAVAFFLQKVYTLKPHFQVDPADATTIAEICVRLEGVPLALELAASRLKHLSLQALLVRLTRRLEVVDEIQSDGPLIHQQTLRTTLSWSYQLLPFDAQQLFMWSAVFVGGFTLASYEVFVRLLHSSLDVLQGLTLLVEHNLLYRSDQDSAEPRFQMLEIVREYGMELLAASGELEQAQRAYILCYRDLVKKVSPMLRGRQQGYWLNVLEQERYNLQAIIQWLLARQQEEDHRLALQFTAELDALWLLRGYAGEGRSFLEQALAKSYTHPDDELLALQGSAYYVAGAIALWQMDNTAATYFFTQGLQCFRALHHTARIASSLKYLAVIENDLGEFAQADATFEESLHLYRAVDDKQGMISMLMTRVITLFFRGAFEQVHVFGTEGLALLQATGDVWRAAVIELYLGWVKYYQGAAEDGYASIEKCIETFRQLGNLSFLPEALTVMAGIIARRSPTELEHASALLEESLALGRKAESSEDIARAMLAQGRLAMLQNNQAKAVALYTECVYMLAEGRAIAAKVRWILATAIEGLGVCALREGDVGRCATLFGCADTVRTVHGQRTPIGMDQMRYEQIMTEMRTRLGKRRFAHYLAEGRQMTPMQAVSTPIERASERTSQKAARRHSINDIEPLTSEPAAPVLLTEREREILRLLAAGRTNKEIAQHLVISASTVNVHVQSLYNKLGVSSRSAATNYALEHHLL